jgi:hypothetical protein
MAATRTRARERALQLLGAADLTDAVLHDLAMDALGAERASRLSQLVRRAPITRRADALASIAALIVGTRRLGVDWWTNEDEEIPPGSFRRPGSPDRQLSDEGDGVLTDLEHWIADAAADASLGLPIDYVDLNNPRSEDRVKLPVGATVGDKYVAAYDPGSRVEVIVVPRGDGIGSRLGATIDDPAVEVAWAWAIATDTGPVLLRGETSTASPFAVELDASIAARLAEWARAHGATEHDLCLPWKTMSDLWTARFRLGLPYQRTGEWFAFDRAVAAVVEARADARDLVGALT